MCVESTNFKKAFFKCSRHITEIGPAFAAITAVKSLKIRHDTSVYRVVRFVCTWYVVCGCEICLYVVCISDVVS